MDLLFYTHESKLYGLTIFVSIVTFQIVYVFVQWLIKHRRDYLFYIAYLFFVIVFGLSHYDKYLNFYPFSGIAERYYEYINLSAPLLCILLYFRFMREFLNLKHRRPDINTMVKNLEFFLIAYTLLSPFFIWLSLDIAVWKMIFNVVAIITITAGLFIIINFLKKSIPLDRFAMTGASLIAVGSIFDIALSFLEFRGFNIPFDIHLPLMVCVIGELTTFTLGLAFKTQFVENEKLFVEKNFLSEKSEKQQLQLDILKLRNNLARELHDDIGAQHIKRSLSIPLDELPHRLNEFSPDTKYLLVCKGGYHSMIAASILKRNGINQVVNISGGFDAVSAFQPQYVESI